MLPVTSNLQRVQINLIFNNVYFNISIESVYKSNLNNEFD